MSTTLIPHRSGGTRLLAWLRADPGRAQAAIGGLAVCVATGCAIGLGAGLAADSLVTFLRGLVTGP